MLKYIALALVGFIGTLTLNGQVTNQVSQEKWKLIWSDEFDGKTVDKTKWNISDEAPVKNNEVEYYSPNEVYVENGCLVLRSQKKEMGGRPYTSGLVDTKGKFFDKFIGVAVRAKLPGGQGIWPAFWMMCQDGSWPPEIDIMEMLGHNTHKIWFGHIFGRWPDIHRLGWDKTFKDKDFSADFHIYSVDWRPNRITFYIDGQSVYSTNQNIPQKEFYIILNTAVGGRWEGSHEEPGYPDNTTKFPQYNLIDYVRVYKLDVKE